VFKKAFSLFEDVHLRKQAMTRSFLGTSAPDTGVMKAAKVWINRTRKMKEIFEYMSIIKSPLHGPGRIYVNRLERP